MNVIIPTIISSFLLQGEPIENQSEQEIRSSLNAINTDLAFTLTVVAENGHIFTHSVGDSSLDTPYESASTSKLVTSTILMWLVQNGLISLDDKPQDHISWWPDSGTLSQITLRHLLSFTSGLNTPPACIDLPDANFESCIAKIAFNNGNSLAPGEGYDYNSVHMQVAGLMAIRALNVDSWKEVFKQFQTEFNIFSHSAYNLPSTTNPRLAGGMTWTARDYRKFLKKLSSLDIVDQPLLNEMSTSQTARLNIIGSPWGYGLGLWVECDLSEANCSMANRISSPGSYGSYPFIDYRHNYYGLVAMQGAPDTINNVYPVFNELISRLEAWAIENKR
ncbi:MAG: serine hydrolase domain-containing protein [Arenicella sp.]